jgi:hypothetical protein
MKRSHLTASRLPVYMTEETNDYLFDWCGRHGRITRMNNHWVVDWPIECRMPVFPMTLELTANEAAELAMAASRQGIDLLSQYHPIAQDEIITVSAPVCHAPQGFVLFGKALYWVMEDTFHHPAAVYTTFLRMGPTSKHPYAAAFWQFLQRQKQVRWVKVNGKVYVEEAAAQKIFFQGNLKQKHVAFRLSE